MNTQQTTPSPPGDDQEQWLQRPNEPGLWYGRFTDFLLQGPARSVQAAYNAEKSRKVEGSRAKTKSASLTWYQHSRLFDWIKRAEAYDTWQRKVLFSKGNASDLERVKKLDTLIEKLYERVETMLAKASPEKSFNEKPVMALLQAFDLMAKHTGSYAAVKLEHSGPGGKPIEIEETKLNVLWYMPEIDHLPDMTTLVEEVDDTPTTKDTQENV